MKKRVTEILITVGLLLTILCPAYQTIDSSIKNTEGDGISEYGNNPVFKNILGIKKVYSYFDPGYGWVETEEVSIQTPMWMQNIFDIPKEVSKRLSSSETKMVKSDGFNQVMIIRFIIKSIPILLLIVGLILEKNKREVS